MKIDRIKEQAKSYLGLNESGEKIFDDVLNTYFDYLNAFINSPTAFGIRVPFIGRIDSNMLALDKYAKALLQDMRAERELTGEISEESKEQFRKVWKIRRNARAHYMRRFRIKMMKRQLYKSTKIKANTHDVQRTMKRLDKRNRPHHAYYTKEYLTDKEPPTVVKRLKEEHESNSSNNKQNK